jgi:aspartate/methionine/tyrosine aminotransferase
VRQTLAGGSHGLGCSGTVARFGDYGDGHVRFSLIENEERTRLALRGIKAMLAKG